MSNIATEQGEIRKAVIKELRRVYPRGRQPAHLAWLIANSHIACTTGQVITELEYLKGIAYVETLPADAIDKAAPPFWRLTAAGIDYHDEKLA